MNKKKMMLLLVSMFTLVLLSIGGTMAYLTDKDSAQNTMTIGKVAIEIQGTAETKALAPGDKAEKNPSVSNVGINPCWIRVEVKVPQFTGAESQKKEDLFTLNDINTANWTKAEDGYYYYGEKVMPNKATSDLFKSVTLSKNYIEGSDLAGAVLVEGQPSADVVVVAEAVQSEGLIAENAQAAFAEVGAIAGTN